MLPKLLKFIIRTRFSRPFLILMAVLVIYEVAISSVVPPQSENLILSYYGTAIIALFLAMALATGGVMVLKSDRDYLFTLPLSSRDLSISIFFSQFIAFGITVLFMFVYLSSSLASVFLLADLVALALTFTSLGILATSLTTKVRAVLSVAVAAWTLLGIARFPISPGAAFNGNVYPGTATLLVLAAVTTTAAFRGLSQIELDMMKNLVRSTSSEIKSQVSYSGKSPIGAIYSMNLSTVSLAGRMNMAGASRYVSRRVKTRWLVAATSIAAAGYFGFVLYLGAPTPFSVGSDSTPAAIVVAIALTLFSFFLSQSAITNERIWLSLTSLPPSTYFRHLVASRVVSLLFILGPFAAADAALLVLGYGEALGALIVIATIIPGSYVLEILWAAYVAPIQVKGDDMMMQAQFSVRQMSTALPLVAVFLLVSLATLFPIVAVIGGLTLITLAALLTASGRFWGRVLTKLTESGFV
ncbi:MAG TPA: hypothetical protein VJR06_01870 [Nitrososphaerales archaeon]|nr:hypothetical protein [Nitrososphaerales archaeon]